ncbi:MAG: TIGR02117 family protein [Pseudomonadota bacterium]|nr:TIGR02117 family protein [Pseudomonadota bacterium]
MAAFLAAIRRSRTARIILWALGTVVALPLSYFLTAALLGTLPANFTWREPEQGIAIFVRTNGVHTWIMMPKVAAGVDWRPYAPPEHLAESRYGYGNYVAVGYGNREFYLNTPTWGDLTLSTAFAAAFGRGRSLLHVEHDHDPQPNEWQSRILLRPHEYRRLADFVSARFELDPQGRTKPLLGRGFGPADMFYEANGGYSFVLTCNEWTGRALRHAGVRMGVWTPLAQSIMWRLD